MVDTNTVYFVRHGESEWNRMNLFCGWHDVNLSSKGIYDVVLLTSPALVNENIKFDMAFTSVLKRTIKTLEIIMNSLHQPNIKMYSSWRLNERHYGALVGFNKRQMANVHGEEKVQQWRRSFDIVPPPMLPTHAYYNHIKGNPKFANIPDDQFPYTESLQTSMERVIPYWEDCIVPEIKKKKSILVVGHGTSLRAIAQHVEKWDKDEIVQFNVPNCIPFLYEFDIKTMKKIGNIKFLADEEFVKQAMAKTMSLGN